jgi:hypothetical protein
MFDQWEQVNFFTEWNVRRGASTRVTPPPERTGASKERLIPDEFYRHAALKPAVFQDGQGSAIASTASRARRRHQDLFQQSSNSKISKPFQKTLDLSPETLSQESSSISAGH